MVNIHRLSISPPLVNSSCAWASDLKQLEELYASPFTGAVTTRTATPSPTGFAEDPAVHTVVFSNETITSINSYGYSPHPLSQYITWISSILTAHPASKKPFIISLTTSDPSALSTMLSAIQSLRSTLQDSPTSPLSRIGVELNTSCPNITGAPPPAYVFASLVPLLEVFAKYFAEDETLTIGLKLPPYVYSTQFDDVLNTIDSFTTNGKNPIAFLTCTNTLGTSLLFADQVIPSSSSEYGLKGRDWTQFALPTPLGGLGGASIHALSLGNVHTFTHLLSSHPSPALRAITVIGVGGVTSSAAAARMRKAGAKVVGCATLLGREGVRAFEGLLEDGIIDML